MDFFTTWVRKLRFELKQDPPRNFEPARLDPGVIVNVATQVLGQVEWKEIYPALPAGHPYGYLVLQGVEGRQVFNLVRDHSAIGRSHDCDVVLPECYGRVSKKHCVIHRSLDGITITDLASRNGTYKDERRIGKTTRLEHGNVLTLGGASSSKKPCILRFELHEMESRKTNITEEGTQRIHPGTQ